MCIVCKVIVGYYSVPSCVVRSLRGRGIRQGRARPTPRHQVTAIPAQPCIVSYLIGQHAPERAFEEGELRDAPVVHECVALMLEL